MIKKLLVLLMIFFLFGCTKSEPTEEEDIIEFIAPAKDVFIFSELDSGTQYRIKKANNNNEYKNYQFDMLFKDVYDGDLKDINGNTINLKDYDELILEVVSVECSHCKNQLQYIDDFLKLYDGIFVQYFNVGDKDEIREFYGDTEIPEDLIIVPRDEELKDYILYELGLKKYPSMIAYYDDKVSFMCDGEMEVIGFREFCTLGFEERLNREDLVDINGNDLLSINRTVDDVKNDLSIENQEKISQLDNDGYTEELTYSLMSKRPDLKTMSNRKSDVYFNEIDDFSVYEDKELVLLYTYLRDNSQTERVEFINELIKDNPDLSFIVILIEGAESSSAALKNMNIRFNCPVVSVLGMIPDDLFTFGIAAYPTAVFLQKGTYTGAYSNILDKETFKKATTIFLGEGCVAYKNNNQTNG
ncbi:MAG: hypothetical protein J6S38_00875 [Erysipelotrichaceae bacterium]|nr:hypothetical protein [Erysipelotrichaceae bacterium]